jgi:hypothetical protein
MIIILTLQTRKIRSPNLFVYRTLAIPACFQASFFLKNFSYSFALVLYLSLQWSILLLFFVFFCNKQQNVGLGFNSKTLVFVFDLENLDHYYTKLLLNDKYFLPFYYFNTIWLFPSPHLTIYQSSENYLYNGLMIVFIFLFFVYNSFKYLLEMLLVVMNSFRFCKYGKVTPSIILPLPHPNCTVFEVCLFVLSSCVSVCVCLCCVCVCVCVCVQSTSPLYPTLLFPNLSLFPPRETFFFHVPLL